MIESFAESSNGLLLMANGFDPVLRWNSLTAQAEPAGCPAPFTAPALSGTGVGPIVGTYFAYLRFIDEELNFSNLSPISAEFDPVGTTGIITAASNASPIVITSAAHHLTTGTMVKISGVGGNTSANNTWPITVIDANNFSLDNSHGQNDYTGGGIWTSGVQTIVYTNVEVPASPFAIKRQILRNTDGQTDTFYVDVETTDLTSSTFSSTRDDTDLASQVAQSILDTSGQPLANIYYIPPNHKGVLVQHQDRMFAAVEYPYANGNAIVNFGSALVAGVGTEWTASMVGRFFYVVGASQPYEIAAVDTVLQIILLTETYADTTDAFAIYAIRPAPAERRLVYFSEAGFPEAWPPTNALSVVEDGDEIIGLMPKGSFLYILERRHIYRMTFQADPNTDGAVFLGANRGCINQRCWVVVEDAAYMLDEQGVHAFSGGQQSEPISAQIADLFRPGANTYESINWAASDMFHCVHYQPQETIRWFICLSGYVPRHALCYNYRLKRWWIEQFTVPIGASVFGRINGVPQIFLGGPAKKVLGYWSGTLDGPDPTAGTVQGVVTSATLTNLTDSLANFPATGVVGSPLAITYGAGKGQVRLITQVSSHTLLVNQPWQVLPDTTSIYQIGGIQYHFRSGWYRWAPSEDHQERRVELVFEPMASSATLDILVYADFSAIPVKWAVDMDFGPGSGVQSRAGSSDLVVDLTKQNGFVQKRMPNHSEFYLDGWRFIQVALTGFSAANIQAIYSVTIDGAAGSKGGG